MHNDPALTRVTPARVKSAGINPDCNGAAQVPAVPIARRTLATNVKHLRRSRAWSQDELAYKAGLHRTFIGHVECAARNISLDNIEKIANALQVPVAQLLTAPQLGKVIPADALAEVNAAVTSPLAEAY